MISENVIEQVLNRADIVDIVGSFITLKKRGRLYEACCPFHQEKTPSFKVDPARNTWHCFGACSEGGNVIGFVMKHENMSFPEAVKTLAAKYGIAVEEEKQTDEQRRRSQKRDSMFIINQKAAEYYAKNLFTPVGDAARKYAEGRWGKDLIRDMGIGFALDGWQGLIDYAKASGLSTDLMLEIGIIKKSEKGRLYDVYRNRVMIPIRDRFHRVIGFTARDISNIEGTAKYMNSAESEIYSKSKSVFGIETAIREAARQDKFNLVEGAPDVISMQKVGVCNTIASLGSAWTVNQLDSLKKYATKLCFLPDADEIKGEEKYGTGIKKVMKNGLLAMKCGFSVSVKEIPLGTGGKKADPGSYIVSRMTYDDLPEEEFVAWYARYLFGDCESIEDKSRAINTVCRLIAALKDDVKEEMYISKMQAIYKNKALWTTAMNQARKELQASKVIDESKKIDRDLYEKYGFYEEHNCYYSITDGGKAYQWSNFVMIPMFHIKDSLNPKRLYRIKNVFNVEEIIEMKQEDLVSLSKFKQRVEGLGNFIWLATEREMTRLKMFLYEQTETAVEIVQLGWQRKGFFAFGNGAFDTDWHPVDEYGIVRLKEGNFYLPASSKIYRDDVKLFQFERRFVHNNYSAISLKQYSEKLIGVFGDNAKIGICFLLATLFRDIITGYTKSFPILNLFGPKGSGKSELGHSLMSFFIAENTPPNIQNATIAAMADLVAQCANALVHIDEYKNSIDIDKREFLKGLWDGSGRSRMNMDRDKKREITSVDCGVILSGQEMTTVDIALFSRLIYLTFNKTEFSNEEKQRFNELREVRKQGLSHLTLQLLHHRTKMETDYYRNYTQCMSELNDSLQGEQVEDRIQRNWVIPLAAFRTLESAIDVPFSYKEVFDITVRGIKTQNQECKSNNELAGFWNMVSFLLQNGEIYIEGDYRIDYLPKLRTNRTANEIEFKRPKPILMMRKNRIFMLYKKSAKQVGDTVLPTESLKFYLENSKEYLGVKKAVRFKNIQKGIEVQKEVPSATTTGSNYEKTAQVDQAMCFDYELIEEHYNINLEIDTPYSEQERRDIEQNEIVETQAKMPF